MIAEDKKVRLQRALEFAVFSNTPLFLTSDLQPELKGNLTIKELNEKTFTAELRATGKNEAAVRKLLACSDLKVLFAYKQHSVVFVTKLVAPIQLGNEGGEFFAMLTLDFPNNALATNERGDYRAAFPEIAEKLKATLEVSTSVGPLTFLTRKFHNLSQTAIAVFLDRESGVALPNDEVTKFRLFLNDKLVMETVGRIQRVDMKSSKAEADGTYLVVVKFASATSDGTLRMKNSERRKSQRVWLLDQQAAFVTCRHPLFSDYEFSGPIADISSSGMSFLVNSSRFPIMQGMVLRDVELQLPMHPRLKTSFRVLSCQAMEGEDEKRYRLGGELVDISSELLKAINQTIQKNMDRRLIDATADDYEKLWEFFFETGFIYSNKRKQIQDYAQSLFKTYTKLLKSNAPIVKKILYKESGEIRGHVSAVKIYDHAWLIQHLNALRSGDSASAAQSVLKAMSEFFIDRRANELVGSNYVICFYRPDNLYPAMLFGETKEYIADKNKCDSEDLQFCLLKDTPDLALVTANEIECRVAQDADLAQFEDLLIGQGYYRLLRMEGLTKAGMTDLKIASEFEKLGLYRSRKVFRALHQTTGDSAYAVCNYSSAGLNLSELTNSIRIFYSGKDAGTNLKLAESLTAQAIETYQKTEMASPVFLREKDHPLPARFQGAKMYRYWSLDARHMNLFREASNLVFDNVKQYVKKYRREEDAEAAG